MSSTEAPFYASPDERVTRSRAGWARFDRTLLVALLAATALYTLLFALLIYENATGVTVAPEEQEIPVEIVTEPPPPEPTPIPTPTPTPTQQAAPPPMAQPDDEKPAYDAPRKGNNDKRDDEISADPNKPSAAPPPPAEPVPTPEPAKPIEADTPPLPQAPDGEVPTMAKVEPQPPEKPAPAPTKTAPMFASVPDVDFGGAAKMAAVSGGMAKSTYLSILYGMIMPHMHVPAKAHTYTGKIQGVISFTVDNKGRLMERFVAQASGSSELDAAAMQAVAEASPFPPPPRGGPIGISFQYSPH